MKKIGIITFHDALNYGAVLQAYALKQTIEKQGALVNVINYDCPTVSDSSNFKSLVMTKPLYKGIALVIARYHTIKKFTLFREKYLALTKRVCEKDDLSDLCSTYDILIVGSDQVWNSRWTKGDNTYLLDIDNYGGHKYSYAASFGTDILNNDLNDYYTEALLKFDSISVREKSAQTYIEKTLKLKCEQHVDPTLLLKRCEWDKIAIKPKVKKPYLILYMVPRDDSLQEYARNYAKKHNLDIILLSRTFRYPFVKHSGCASPQEFLGYVKNADYIITNSFHGTAFSIIYNKKCYIKLDNSRGYNVRSRDLLAQLSIIDATFNESCYATDEVDWDRINTEINIITSKSIEYLRNMIV